MIQSRCYLESGGALEELSDGVGFRGARFDLLEATRLEARVEVGPSAAVPVREIKGVTLHGLEVEREEGGWRARVIFDV